MTTKKRPPYDFILEELDEVITNIKPMFGAYGVYRDHQILMILRKKEKMDNDTGLWLALPDQAVLEMKTLIPQLNDLQMFGQSPTAWQVVRETLPDFEEVCLQICELIRKKDPRIGRTPKTRLKSTQAKKKITSKKKKKLNTLSF